MKKSLYKVRFPKESFFEDFYLDFSEFKIQSEFDEEFFGHYKGLFICVKK